MTTGSFRGQILGFLIFGLAGCAGTPLRQAMVEPQSEISLCDITGNPEQYLGKIRRVSVKYSVVKLHTAAYSDDRCESRKRILEGSSRDADLTVTAFNREGDKICELREESLCVLEAELTVDIRISKDIDGVYYADPIHVVRFAYLTSQE